jgi:ABC-type multidrug transport system fused ATPase/permease subunit
MNKPTPIENIVAGINSGTINTATLSAYAAQQKKDILQDIEDRKKLTFDNVYGGLGNAQKLQSSVMKLDQRTKQLNQIQNNVAGNQGTSIDHLTRDKDLAKRKYEMNEWSVQNKKETLFIYSMFLILISSIVLFSALLNMGMISSYLFSALVIPLVIIFIFVLIYRARFTTNYRNKRYWSKRRFNEDAGKLKIGQMSICPTAEELAASTGTTSA